MALTLEELKDEVRKGQIDTVVVGSVDMQGRLIGKRLTGRHFVDSMGKKNPEMTMCCYFLAMTVDGHTGEGYEVANWDQGWSNCIVRPCFDTLRRTPWMPATALIIGDTFDQLTGQPFFCCPRAILHRQVRQLAELGLRARMASELEFFLFLESHKSAREKRWTKLETAQPHNRCLHVLAGSVDEPFMSKVRNGLEAAGVLLEATHAEYGAGQQELNFVPAEPVEMADRHILAKHGIHEMANQAGLAATFMAKYNKEDVGSSCHIHMSLEHNETGKSAFYDSDDEFGMTKMAKQWLAGLVKYASEYTYFLAPYINSYKRLQPISWAPTKICWSVDNRTSSFRLCNQCSPGVHLECRIGGADLNPYLAFAALFAAGIAGINEGLTLAKPAVRNIYVNKELPEIPTNLKTAATVMANSEMLKKAFGDQTIRHYANTARLELAEFDKQVTDWELMRGFDRF